MLNYEVIVGGQPKRLPVAGDVLHVAAERLGVGPNAQHVVRFWAEGSPTGPEPARRAFQVFGTGHPLPENAVWRGTTDRTPEGLVWHLYELAGE